MRSVFAQHYLKYRWQRLGTFNSGCAKAMVGLPACILKYPKLFFYTFSTTTGQWTSDLVLAFLGPASV